MIPRFGEPYNNTQRYRLRPGAYAILPRQHQILLTVQHGDKADLQLPGGGIDPGESPIHALHREVFEETGWRIAKPRYLTAFRRFVFMPDYGFWAEKLCRIYVAKPIYQIADPSEPNHEAALLDIDVAASNLGNDGDRTVLRSYIRTPLT
ncbi:MAG: NUDIX domain-containing protein [Paracoccaceae bacterium]